MSLRTTIYKRLIRRREYQIVDRLDRKAEALAASGAPGLLDEFLDRTRKSVAWYRDALSAAPQPAPLDAWPVLTKDMVRDGFDRLKADDLDSRKWFYTHTGGSTGQPARFVQDAEFRFWNWASENYVYRHLIGIEPVEDRIAILWGSRHDVYGQTRSLGRRARVWFSGTTLTNAYRLTEPGMRDFIAEMNRTRPALLKGYTGAIYELARFVQRTGLRVHVPRAVYTTAETLQEETRALIEEVFQARVHDVYGSREAGAVAAECSHGRMHLLQFNAHTELLRPDNQPATPGEHARVVVTTLHNHAMPLVRYEIGDMASPVAGACPCGSPLPAMTSVLGRYSDYFVNAAGDLIYSGYIRQVLFACQWIREYYAEQSAVDLVNIHYTPAAPGDEDDRRDIERKIRLAMGDTCRIEWHEVAELPRTPHGKQMHTRSLVHENPSEIFRAQPRNIVQD